MLQAALRARGRRGVSRLSTPYTRSRSLKRKRKRDEEDIRDPWGFTPRAPRVSPVTPRSDIGHIRRPLQSRGGLGARDMPPPSLPIRDPSDLFGPPPRDDLTWSEPIARTPRPAPDRLSTLFDSRREVDTPEVDTPEEDRPLDRDQVQSREQQFRALTPWNEMIERESRLAGVDPEIIRAIIWVESGGDPDAVSHRIDESTKQKYGTLAHGLMQIIRGAASDMGVPYSSEEGFLSRFSEEQFGERSLFNPLQNLRAGINYYKRELERFEGNEALALAAYNQGSGNIPEDEQGNWVIPQKGKDYLAKINRALDVGFGGISEPESRELGVQSFVERNRLTGPTSQEKQEERDRLSRGIQDERDIEDTAKYGWPETGRSNATVYEAAARSVARLREQIENKRDELIISTFVNARTKEERAELLQKNPRLQAISRENPASLVKAGIERPFSLFDVTPLMEWITGENYQSRDEATLQQELVALEDKLNLHQDPNIREAKIREFGIDKSLYGDEEAIVTSIYDKEYESDVAKMQEFASRGDILGLRREEAAFGEKYREIQDRIDKTQIQIFAPGDDRNMSEEEQSILRYFYGDLPIRVARMIIGAPEILVNAADIPLGGRIGYIMEQHGYNPREINAHLADFYSNAEKRAGLSWQEADTLLGSFEALFTNTVPIPVAGRFLPRVAVGATIESLPFLFGMRAYQGIARKIASGVLPKALGRVAPKLVANVQNFTNNPAAMAWTTEGAMMAGAAGAQMRDESPSGLLTRDQQLLATGVGVVGGGIARVGAAVAKRMGIVDIDQIFLGGGRKELSQKGTQWVTNVGKAMLQEGAFEEAPQSILEELAANWDRGKRGMALWDGTDKAALLGGMAGAITGGAITAGAMPRAGTPRELLATQLLVEGNEEFIRDAAVKKGWSNDRINKTIQSASEGNRNAFRELADVYPDLVSEGKIEQKSLLEFVEYTLDLAGDAPVAIRAGEEAVLQEETPESLLKREGETAGTLDALLNSLSLSGDGLTDAQKADRILAASAIHRKYQGRQAGEVVRDKEVTVQTLQDELESLGLNSKAAKNKKKRTLARRLLGNPERKEPEGWIHKRQETQRGEAAQIHRSAVQDAIANNPDSVPDAVLKDYQGDTWADEEIEKRAKLKADVDARVEETKEGTTVVIDGEEVTEEPEDYEGRSISDIPDDADPKTYTVPSFEMAGGYSQVGGDVDLRLEDELRQEGSDRAVRYRERTNTKEQAAEQAAARQRRILELSPSQVDEFIRRVYQDISPQDRRKIVAAFVIDQDVERSQKSRQSKPGVTKSILAKMRLRSRAKKSFKALPKIFRGLFIDSASDLIENLWHHQFIDDPDASGEARHPYGRIATETKPEKIYDAETDTLLTRDEAEERIKDHTTRIQMYKDNQAVYTEVSEEEKEETKGVIKSLQGHIDSLKSAMERADKGKPQEAPKEAKKPTGKPRKTPKKDPTVTDVEKVLNQAERDAKKEARKKKTEAQRLQDRQDEIDQKLREQDGRQEQRDASWQEFVGAEADNEFRVVMHALKRAFFSEIKSHQRDVDSGKLPLPKQRVFIASIAGLREASKGIIPALKYLGQFDENHISRLVNNAESIKLLRSRGVDVNDFAEMLSRYSKSKTVTNAFAQPEQLANEFKRYAAQLNLPKHREGILENIHSVVNTIHKAFAGTLVYSGKSVGQIRTVEVEVAGPPDPAKGPTKGMATRTVTRAGPGGVLLQSLAVWRTKSRLAQDRARGKEIEAQFDLDPSEYSAVYGVANTDLKPTQRSINKKAKELARLRLRLDRETKTAKRKEQRKAVTALSKELKELNESKASVVTARLMLLVNWRRISDLPAALAESKADVGEIDIKAFSKNLRKWGADLGFKKITKQGVTAEQAGIALENSINSGVDAVAQWKGVTNVALMESLIQMDDGQHQEAILNQGAIEKILRRFDNDWMDRYETEIKEIRSELLELEKRRKAVGSFEAARLDEHVEVSQFEGEIIRRIQSSFPPHMFDEGGAFSGLFPDDLAVLRDAPGERFDVVKVISALESVVANMDELQRQVIHSVLRPLMALDTRIDWSDVTLVYRPMVDDVHATKEKPSKANGFYQRVTNTIFIGSPEFEHTPAHEFGHALSHKWLKELVGAYDLTGDSALGIFESKSSFTEKKFPVTSKERLDWVNAIRSLVTEAGIDAYTATEYWASPEEIFARFVDAYVSWTEEQATGGAARLDELLRGPAKLDGMDKFRPEYFTAFAKLLQAKQAIDIGDGNPFGSEYANYPNPFNFHQWVKKLPPAIMAHAAKVGAVVLDAGFTSEEDFKREFLRSVQDAVKAGGYQHSEYSFDLNKLRELWTNYYRLSRDLGVIEALSVLEPSEIAKLSDEAYRNHFINVLERTREARKLKEIPSSRQEMEEMVRYAVAKSSADFVVPIRDPLHTLKLDPKHLDRIKKEVAKSHRALARHMEEMEVNKTLNTEVFDEVHGLKDRKVGRGVRGVSFPKYEKYLKELAKDSAASYVGEVRPLDAFVIKSLGFDLSVLDDENLTMEQLLSSDGLLYAKSGEDLLQERELLERKRKHSRTEREERRYQRLNQIINMRARRTTANTRSGDINRIASILRRHIPEIHKKSDALYNQHRKTISRAMDTVAPVGQVKNPDGSTAMVVSVAQPSSAEAMMSSIQIAMEEERREREVDTTKSPLTERLEGLEVIPHTLVQAVIGDKAMQLEAKRSGPYKGLKVRLRKNGDPLPLVSEEILKQHREGKITADEIVRKNVVGIMKSNLTALFEAYPETLRESAALWYEGANKLARGLADEYGISMEQAVGIIATLSPQADWQQNIARARRLISVYQGIDKGEFPRGFTDELAETYFDFTLRAGEDSLKIHKKNIYNKEQTEEFRENAKRNYEKWRSKKILELQNDALKMAGRPIEVTIDLKGEGRKPKLAVKWLAGPPMAPLQWSDMDLEYRAKLIRTIEETAYVEEGAEAGSRKYRIYEPDGTPTGEHGRNEDGGFAALTWGSYGEMAGAVSIMEDESFANIQEQLGAGPKVRSFFNNISAPHYDGSVTIDTHAIAAAFMQAYGGNEPIVKLVMSGPAASEIGYLGLNAVVAEAYFSAAKDLGISPRALQSITWEAVRGLFPSELKTTRIDKTNEQWDRFRENKLTLDELQQAVLKDSSEINYGDKSGTTTAHGSFRDPDWADETFRNTPDESGVSIPLVAGQSAPVSTRRGIRDDSPLITGRRTAKYVGRVFSDDEKYLATQSREGRDAPGVLSYPRPSDLRKKYGEKYKEMSRILMNAIGGSAELSVDAPPMFYSNLARLIEEKVRNKDGKQVIKTVTPKELLGWVVKTGKDGRTHPRNGVKLDELQFLGFEHWVKNIATRYKQRTTKAGVRHTKQGPVLVPAKRTEGNILISDVLNFLTHNNVRVVEFTIASSRAGGVAPTDMTYTASETGVLTERHTDLGGEEVPDTMSYSSGGGTNYRQIILVIDPIVHKGPWRPTVDSLQWDKGSREALQASGWPDPSGAMAHQAWGDRESSGHNLITGGDFTGRLDRGELDSGDIRGDGIELSVVANARMEIADGIPFAHIRIHDRDHPTYSNEEVEQSWKTYGDALYTAGWFSRTEGEYNFHFDRVVRDLREGKKPADANLMRIASTQLLPTMVGYRTRHKVTMDNQDVSGERTADTQAILKGKKRQGKRQILTNLRKEINREIEASSIDAFAEPEMRQGRQKNLGWVVSGDFKPFPFGTGVSGNLFHTHRVPLSLMEAEEYGLTRRQASIIRHNLLTELSPREVQLGGREGPRPEEHTEELRKAFDQYQYDESIPPGTYWEKVSEKQLFVDELQSDLFKSQRSRVQAMARAYGDIVRELEKMRGVKHTKHGPVRIKDTRGRRRATHKVTYPPFKEVVATKVGSPLDSYVDKNIRKSLEQDLEQFPLPDSVKQIISENVDNDRPDHAGLDVGLLGATEQILVPAETIEATNDLSILTDEDFDILRQRYTESYRELSRFRPLRSKTHRPFQKKEIAKAVDETLSVIKSLSGDNARYLSRRLLSWRDAVYEGTARELRDRLQIGEEIWVGGDSRLVDQRKVWVGLNINVFEASVLEEVLAERAGVSFPSGARMDFVTPGIGPTKQRVVSEGLRPPEHVHPDVTRVRGVDIETVKEFYDSTFSLLSLDDRQTAFRKFRVAMNRAGEDSLSLPVVPLQRTWHMNAFKRVLRLAVQGGYDSVGWASGQTHRDRYQAGETSEPVTRIEWRTEVVPKKTVDVNPYLDTSVKRVTFSMPLPGYLLEDIRKGVSARRDETLRRLRQPSDHSESIENVQSKYSTMEITALVAPNGDIISGDVDFVSKSGSRLSSREMEEMADRSLSMEDNVAVNQARFHGAGILSHAVYLGRDIRNVIEKSVTLPIKSELTGSVVDAVLNKESGEISGAKLKTLQMRLGPDQTTFEGFYDQTVRNEVDSYLSQWNATPSSHQITESRRGLRLDKERLEKTTSTHGPEPSGSFRVGINNEMRSGVQGGQAFYEKKSFTLEQLELYAKKTGAPIKQVIKSMQDQGVEIVGYTPTPEIPKGVQPEPRGASTPDPSVQSGDPLLPVTEIIQKLAKALGNIPVVVGRTRGARGKYDEKTSVIFMKTANDLEVFAHEMGHHIHTTMFPDMESEELIDLGRRTAKPAGGAAPSRGQLHKEGVAEFFRIWSHNPNHAKHVAPHYYSEFEAAIRSHPLGKAVLEFQKAYIDIFNATGAARFANSVNFYRRALITHSDFLLGMEVAWLNTYAPIKRAVRDMVQLERESKRGRSVLQNILGEKDMPDNVLDDAFKLAELARGSSMKARGWLNSGIKTREAEPMPVTDAEGNVVKGAFHGGIKDALEPISDEAKQLGLNADNYLEAFAIYLVARHVPESENAGKATGGGGTVAERIAEAEAYVKEYETAAFKTAAQNIYDFQSALLQYGIDEGVLDQETANRVRTAYQYYVPLQRVQDEIESVSNTGLWKKFTRSTSGLIKKRVGSGRDTIMPLESIVQNTFRWVQKVEANKALLALADQADKTAKHMLRPGQDPSEIEGVGQIMHPISAKMKRIVVKRDEDKIKNELEEAGVLFPDDIDLGALIEVFRPSETAEDQTIRVFRNGEAHLYKIVNRDLYDALVEVGTVDAEIFSAIFTKPAALLRMSATTAIEFLLRNPMKDTLVATVSSESGFRPVWDTVSGLFDIIGGTSAGKKAMASVGAKSSHEWYMKFLNSGAGGHSLGSIDRNTIREEFRRLGFFRRERKAIGARDGRMAQTMALLSDTPRTGVEYLRGAQEALENASRVGEFARAVAKAERAGVGRAEALARGAYSAAQITVNFKRGGRHAKNWNKYKAFFNAAVQGNLRIAEVFKRNPVRATILALTNITFPTIVFWLLNKDDPEFHNLPEWERDIFWFIPVGKEKGHPWIRIPKPFELGHLFANTVEAALDYTYGHQDGPEAIEQVFGTAEKHLMGMAMLIAPTSALPIVEVGSNWSFFRNAPIVSPYISGRIEPEYQTSRYTSETSRMIAKGIGSRYLGAAHIDHLFRGYLAGIGGYLTDTVDELVLRPLGASMGPPSPKQGPWWTRTWGLRGITKGTAATGSARSLEQFYAFGEELETIENTIRAMEERRGSESRAELRAYERKNREYLRHARRYRRARRRIARLGGRIDDMYESDRLSPERRGERINGYWEDIINRSLRFFRESRIY